MRMRLNSLTNDHTTLMRTFLSDGNDHQRISGIHSCLSLAWEYCKMGRVRGDQIQTPHKKQLRLVTCKLYNVIKFSILFHTHHRGRLPIDTIHPILVPRRSHVVMQFLFLYIIKFNIFVGEFNFKQILLLCSSAWECTCNKKNVRKMNE